MSYFGDMTRPQVGLYFEDHGWYLVQARDAFIQATRAYHLALQRCTAFEASLGAERFVDNVLDAAHDPLAEEVREYLES